MTTNHSDLPSPPVPGKPKHRATHPDGRLSGHPGVDGRQLGEQVDAASPRGRCLGFVLNRLAVVLILALAVLGGGSVLLPSIPMISIPIPVVAISISSPGRAAAGLG